MIGFAKQFEPIAVLSYMIAMILLVVGQQGRIDSAPRLGEASPAVEANILGGKEKFSLAANKGKRPTVLIFGSCT